MLPRAQMSGSGRSLPEFEGTDLPPSEDASPRSKFFKTHARRIFYVALAVVLVFALIHLSGSSNASKSTESSEAASPADTSPLSPAADPFSPAAAQAAAAAVAAAKASKESLLTRIVTFLASNQFIVTGVFGAAVAGAVFLLKYLFGTHVYVHINVRPSLILTNLDPNFKIVMDYLSKRCLPTKNQRLLEAETLKDESPQSASKQLRSSWYRPPPLTTTPLVCTKRLSCAGAFETKRPPLSALTSRPLPGSIHCSTQAKRHSNMFPTYRTACTRTFQTSPPNLPPTPRALTSMSLPMKRRWTSRRAGRGHSRAWCCSSSSAIRRYICLLTSNPCPWALEAATVPKQQPNG